MVLMSSLSLVKNGRGFGNDERRVDGATKSGRRQLLGDAGNWRVPVTHSLPTHSAHAFCTGYPPLPNDHDGFSCGAHRYSILHVCLYDCI